MSLATRLRGAHRRLPRRSAATFAAGVWRTWEILSVLTARDLKARYQGTALGFLWSVANPLLLGAVWYFAIKVVVRFDMPDYLVFLLAGLFPWYWFTSTVGAASGVFVGAANLMKKVSFPRIVLPLSLLGNTTVHFLLSVPVVAVFAALAGLTPQPVWLVGVPLLAVLQLGLLFGAVLVVASLNVFLRDLGQLMPTFTFMLFFVTPVIYPLERVPERYRGFIQANPLAALLEGWREVMVENRLPGWEVWPAAVAALALLCLGVLLFRQLEAHFVDVL